MKARHLFASLLFLGGTLGAFGQGKQLTGVYAPTASEPLPPAEAQKKFTVPEGFEVRLFASEPMVVNPVAMTWDERGRLWVVELYEYPLGAPKGAKPRDTVKILEDTDGDGRADKVTVFAEGLNLATAIILGNGGAYVGQAPHLLFLKDTNGDDKADTSEVVMTGFGLEDRHELLNGFTWGPDGHLYMTHGVFTHSLVKDPKKPNDPGVVMNAAVARWHPQTRKFEVFADGTSNPWGVDFDRAGNAFVSACVIDHLFHMAPGGQFVRQGGIWANPYGYADMHSPRGGLASIVDHKHFRAAYCGVQVYQGDQYPKAYSGKIFMGNIHDSSVHMDELKPNGSSFTASDRPDFVRANDGWFRPISIQVGPDGNIWLGDWYDKYPCYQNARADPEGVDRTYGRIWRVVYTGKEKGKPVMSRPSKDMNLAKLPSNELVKLLAHDNVWQRRTAQHVLTERRDNTVMGHLQQLFKNGATIEARMAALWTLHTSGYLNDDVLLSSANDREAIVRTWCARLIGERQVGSKEEITVLENLAKDADPSVRLAVATAARQFTSGSLTVNTPPAKQVELGDVLPNLIGASKDGKDPLVPFMIWMAAEPLIPEATDVAFAWVSEHGAKNMPLAGQLTQKLMRRVCDLGKPELLAQATEVIGKLLDQDADLTIAALNGLLEGQKGKAIVPSGDTTAVLNKLLASNNTQVKERAQRLGTLWGNATAVQGSVKLVNDQSATIEKRREAMQVVRQLKNQAARNAFLEVIGTKNPDPLVMEALRALAEIGGDALPNEILARWNNFTPPVRRAAADIMTTRDRWASTLLSALEQKQVATSDVSATGIRTMMRSQADFGMLARRAQLVFGRVRDADADKTKLIAAKRKMILDSKKQPDLKAGHEIAQRTCFTCHKLYGEGADVGPDLTGVGRSSLNALLANIIDPNQIIGAGYENVEIETKDERIVAGRIIENNDARVKILSAGPKEDTIAKSDIKTMRVSELSVMPEGIEQMSDEDFRNMIAYLLNPPQEKKPFSWLEEDALPEGKPVEKKSEATQPKGKPVSEIKYKEVDWESVSHWNPEWRVEAPEFEATPNRLTDYAGKKNVLITHPYNKEKGAALVRKFAVPAGQKTRLLFDVLAHEKGDWELVVVAKGKELEKRLVKGAKDQWHAVDINLTPLAGQTVELRLENRANNWAWEFGFWTSPKIESVPLTAAIR
jgi:putative membrane-bound dehydrogenase-like protein